MVPVLNSFGIHAAVYGNHDFGEYDNYYAQLLHNNNYTLPQVLNHSVDIHTYSYLTHLFVCMQPLDTCNVK